jgi:hypothetical protein
MSEPEQRATLLAHAPTAPDDAALWWESLFFAAQWLTSQTQGEPEKSGLARLAVIAIPYRYQRVPRAAIHSAISVVNLVLTYYTTGGESSTAFDIDAVVSDCLDLIEVPASVAATTAWDWRSLFIEEIRKLRNAKNLLRPCLVLADRVTDAVVLSRLAEWRPVFELLP